MEIEITCYWHEYPDVLHPNEPGHGNCKICTVSPDNSLCTGFIPVRTILLPRSNNKKGELMVLEIE